MSTIKATILAYMYKSGKDNFKEISVPALDRYLTYVKHEDEYVGGNLLVVLEQMIEEGVIVRGQGSSIMLTEQGFALSIAD